MLSCQRLDSLWFMTTGNRPLNIDLEFSRQLGMILVIRLGSKWPVEQSSSCSAKPSGCYNENENKGAFEFSTIIFIDNISRSQFIVFNSYHIMTYSLYVYVYVYLYIYAINICWVCFFFLLRCFFPPYFRYLGSMRASMPGAVAILSRQSTYLTVCLRIYTLTLP